MNEQIRSTIRQALKDRNLTQAELAQHTGIAQPNISRMLSNKGNLMENWQTLLDYLELELTVQPKEKHQAEEQTDEGGGHG